MGLKKSKFNLIHLILHFSGVTFVTCLIISPIWFKLFTFMSYFLAHRKAKSTKQLGTVNHTFSPWSSTMFFKVKCRSKCSISTVKKKKKGKIKVFLKGTERMLSTLREV